MQIHFFYKDFRSDSSDTVSMPEEGNCFDVWLSTSELTSALTGYDPSIEASIPEDLAKAILRRILDSYIENS